MSPAPELNTGNIPLAETTLEAYWGCIEEPFGIMAHNLLTCALKLERASKRKKSDTNECHSQCKTQYKLATLMASLKTCCICDKLEGNVSKSSTNREWEMATRLQNQGLFAKKAIGEMTALDARYHNQCLTALANTNTNAKSEFNEEQTIGGIVMGELGIYIIWERDQTDTDINSTRIKERLIKMCQT